jgi:hypothetical protein
MLPYACSSSEELSRERRVIRKIKRGTLQKTNVKNGEKKRVTAEAVARNDK